MARRRPFSFSLLAATHASITFFISMTSGSVESHCCDSKNQSTQTCWAELKGPHDVRLGLDKLVQLKPGLWKVRTTQQRGFQTIQERVVEK
jgi:hypothetical protein